MTLQEITNALRALQGMTFDDAKRAKRLCPAMLAEAKASIQLIQDVRLLEVHDYKEEALGILLGQDGYSVERYPQGKGKMQRYILHTPHGSIVGSHQIAKAVTLHEDIVKDALAYASKGVELKSYERGSDELGYLPIDEFNYAITRISLDFKRIANEVTALRDAETQPATDKPAPYAVRADS